MTDAEWRQVCVRHCWLDIDEHILDAMKDAYGLGQTEGFNIGYDRAAKAALKYYGDSDD